MTSVLPKDTQREQK
jgi:hypothetical protein